MKRTFLEEKNEIAQTKHSMKTVTSTPHCILTAVNLIRESAQETVLKPKGKKKKSQKIMTQMQARRKSSSVHCHIW